jgi:hypothetical protein
MKDIKIVNTEFNVTVKMAALQSMKVGLSRKDFTEDLSRFMLRL